MSVTSATTAYILFTVVQDIINFFIALLYQQTILLGLKFAQTMFVFKNMIKRTI